MKHLKKILKYWNCLYIYIHVYVLLTKYWFMTENILSMYCLAWWLMTTIVNFSRYLINNIECIPEYLTSLMHTDCFFLPDKRGGGDCVLNRLSNLESFNVIGKSNWYFFSPEDFCVWKNKSGVKKRDRNNQLIIKLHYPQSPPVLLLNRALWPDVSQYVL